MTAVTALPQPNTTGEVSASCLLDPIFSPASIAVLGVTATPGTVPYDIFYNILSSGYRGTVYPVAPGKRSICAVRAYRYVLDIEDEVDQAVIVFPANVVERALEAMRQERRQGGHRHLGRFPRGRAQGACPRSSGSRKSAANTASP